MAGLVMIPVLAVLLDRLERRAFLLAGIVTMSTWGVSQIPVIENGESLGGLIEGTLMTRALAQPSLLDRPVREVMDSPFPKVDAGLSTERLGAMA